MKRWWRLLLRAPVPLALLVLSALSLLLLRSAPASAAEPQLHLVLNSPFSAPITSAQKDGFLDLLYAELFSRLGITFEIQLLPGERALRNAEAGIDDGDVCRIDGLERYYPNLIRINEPVMEYRMVIFSRDLDFTVTGVETLQPHRLGILSGWKILEEATAEHPRRLRLESTDQLFLMLAAGRLELALIDRLPGLEAIRRLEIDGVRELSPPLLTGMWYLYLHRKHAALLPAIDEELRRMKADGSYERIRRQALAAYELEHLTEGGR